MRSVQADYPNRIIGFFFTAGGAQSSEDDARRGQRRFAERYHLDPARAPPLLRLDLASGGDRPWSLAPTEGQA